MSQFPIGSLCLISANLAVQEDDTPLTQSIKTSFLDYPRKKFADPATDTLLDMASLVDPWFWMKSSQIYTGDGGREI